MKGAGVYKLGIRFDSGEHAKLKDLAEKAGCESIPAFVQYAIENYGKLQPRIDDMRQREIRANGQTRGLEEDAQKVAFAHEEILTQFRKTITEMGTKQDVVNLDAIKKAEREHAQSLCTIAHALGFVLSSFDHSDNVVGCISAIDSLRESVKQIAMKLGVPDTVKHCQDRIEELKKVESERDDLHRMYSELNEKQGALQEKCDNLELARRAVIEELLGAKNALDESLKNQHKPVVSFWRKYFK